MLFLKKSKTIVVLVFAIGINFFRPIIFYGLKKSKFVGGME